MRRFRVNSNLRNTGTLTRRHWIALRDYWTPRKLLNLAVCEAEKRMHVVSPRAMPYTATIDVTNACNLRCPGCPTGAGIVGRPKQMLDLDRLDRFLDETGKYLLITHLYNWGETLLHPRAAEIVERVHRRRIFTSISSNLNIRDFGVIERVCDAGLDHLIVSADGATAETYRRYRVRGDFELVKENVRRIVDYRQRKKRSRPILEWQILSFNYLEDELGAARELARELGVDWFRIKGPTTPERLQPRNRQLAGRFYGGRSTCALLWHNVTLQADGGITPCCNLYHKEDDFGHLDGSSVREIRANEQSRIARMLFDPARLPVLDPQLDHPCLRCPVVHGAEHLAGYLAENPHAWAEFGFMGVTRDPGEADAAWRGL
jgi:MoaA/NifB/PqqE/SkfB family radical SAM enzyme